jgi:hypothetical protein
MQGVFALVAGETLSILVGQQAGASVSKIPAGGGGTFVALGANYTTATPLLVAGGGAGVYNSAACGGSCGGQITEVALGPYAGPAGYGSLAAPCGGGGGGFYSNGGTDTSYSFTGGKGFQQGGAGAVPTPNYVSFYGSGGFGGGGTANYIGACNLRGGAGGGYSGGSSGSTVTKDAGWGGASFNAGSAAINSASSNTGNGFLTIIAGGTFAPSSLPTTSTVLLNALVY